MRRCCHCQRPFGLTRHHVYRVGRGYLAFCSMQCKDAYRREAREKLSAWAVPNWLRERLWRRARCL